MNFSCDGCGATISAKDATVHNRLSHAVCPACGEIIMLGVFSDDEAALHSFAGTDTYPEVSVAGLFALETAAKKMTAQQKRAVARRPDDSQLMALRELLVDPSQEDESPPLKPDDRAGRHRIRRYVGSGGFAHIYCATAVDDYLEGEVALKVLRHVVDRDNLWTVLRRLYRTWKRISQACPERIVGPSSIERIEVAGRSTVGIVMEYMGGGTLADFARAYPPTNEASMRRVLMLFGQVCEGVQVIHSSGFLHRDLKPTNFLLNEAHDVCKLADFESIIPISAERTSVDGTALYHAPECSEGQFSEASETYALGVSLFELLAGVRPSESELRGGRESIAAALSRRNPVVPPELATVLSRCLDLLPGNRPMSVSDLLAELTSLGLTGGVNGAAQALARLLLKYLEDKQLRAFTVSLNDEGVEAPDNDSQYRRALLVEECCYKTPPRKVLLDRCTVDVLTDIGLALGIPAAVMGTDRGDLAGRIAESLGFLPEPTRPYGFGAARAVVDVQLANLPLAASVEEARGSVLAGLSAVERSVGLLVSFYGQAVYGAGASAYLSSESGGKKFDSMTFGDKVRALRSLATRQPTTALQPRVAHALVWPLLEADVLKQLDRLVEARNRLAHPSLPEEVEQWKVLGRRALKMATDVLTKLHASRSAPQVVRVISRKDDEYGRRVFEGLNDQDHRKHIFSPVPLVVGETYLFLPLTDATWINPIIFPPTIREARRPTVFL